MATEAFSKADFEAALPKPTKGNQFIHLGMNQGEHIYAMILPNPQLRILVRSSVGANEIADATGEDSIRIYLQYLSNKNGVEAWSNVKGKVPYTTRIKGWQTRLTSKIRQVCQRAAKVKGSILRPEEGLKFSENKDPKYFDRPFAHIDGEFKRWLDL